jgi:hypothetical protein
MKKVIIASAALFFAAITTNTHAATTTNLETITSVQQDTTEKRTPVVPTELPEPVKTTLAGDDYKGWTASSAFLVAKAGTEYYEIKLTKEGSEPNKVKLDKSGKKVD